MVSGKTIIDSKLSYGDEVVVPWGVDEVHGTVREAYGPAARRRVIIDLTPELTGTVVDEQTTVSLPLDRVRKVAPAV